MDLMRRIQAYLVAAESSRSVSVSSRDDLDGVEVADETTVGLEEARCCSGCEGARA